jgi:zinc transporter 1/2/3
VVQDFAHNIPFFVVLGGYLLIFFVEKIAFDTHGFIEEHHHHPHHGNGVATKPTPSPTSALNSGTPRRSHL